MQVFYFLFLNTGIMDISLLNVLSNGISSFLHPSFSGNMNSKPVSMYCQSAEQTLKLLKPIIDTTVHSDISADEELRKLFEELGQSVDELRELFENWHPLSSKFYFVMQAEPLIINILQKLKASQQCLPDDMTSIIKEAINEQLEGEDSFSGVDNAQHVDPVRISDEESVDLVSQSSTSPSRREASNALRSEQSQNHVRTDSDSSEHSSENFHQGIQGDSNNPRKLCYSTS
ncbi:hypothetical protein S83_017972 [Arachis hypogaea]|uniref:PUB2-4-like N-terminal domain-containing protein n=1 Tax=Arachis hypogaea TaxID=3818 RepID=A0A445CPQ2_ARAHY|nr:hypothetical protein Ahy_A06g027777 isoform C [Arachis hypogaea]